MNVQRQPNPRNRMKGLADCDQTWAPMEMIADGFTMNAALKYLPYRYFPLALGQLDELRKRHGEYRARWITVPQDVNTVIGPFGEFTTTQRVNNGSVLFGFNFCVVGMGSVSDFEVVVGEICTETQWFDQSIDATGLRPTPAAAGGTDLFPVIVEPQVLRGSPQPQLKVVITNKSSAARSCQLLLHLAEPCSAQGVDAGSLPHFPWQYPQGEGQ